MYLTTAICNRTSEDVAHSSRKHIALFGKFFMAEAEGVCLYCISDKDEEADNCLG